jgi:hypothetical protein
MKEPVDHIVRPSLPWRPEFPALTECGYDASKVKVITREAHAKRIKEYGQQRAAMLTCMTCSQTAHRWESWQSDPRKAIGREVEWEAGWHRDRGDQLKDELLAIEALIAAHPEEFRAYLSDLGARREWQQRKGKKPAPEPAAHSWRQL